MTVTEGCNVRSAADGYDDNIIGGLDEGDVVRFLVRKVTGFKLNMTGRLDMYTVDCFSNVRQRHRGFLCLLLYVNSSRLLIF